MNCLIVDAYCDKPSGRNQLSLFVRVIKDTFRRADVEGRTCSFQVVNKTSLNPFIYEHENKGDEQKNLSRFDQLDLVFIGADAYFLPWSEEMRQVITLMRMCFMTNKCLFGVGSAAKAFAFICATKARPIRIINTQYESDGEAFASGKLLNRVKETSRDMFLNYSTGDIMQFNNQKAQLEPFSSSGLRLKNKQSRLPTEYVPVDHKKAPIMYLNDAQYQKCRVIKRFTQHFAFNGLSNQVFVVKNRSRWYLDASANKRSPQRYDVLAKGPNSPLVIERGNTLCIFFEIDRRYRQGETILFNYIKEKCGLLRAKGHIDKTCNLFLAANAYVRKPKSTVNLVSTSQKDSARKRTNKNNNKTEAEQIIQGFQVKDSQKPYVRRNNPHGFRRPWSAKLSSKASLSMALDHRYERLTTKRPTTAPRSRTSLAEKSAKLYSAKSTDSSSAIFSVSDSTKTVSTEGNYGKLAWKTKKKQSPHKRITTVEDADIAFLVRKDLTTTHNFRNIQVDVKRALRFSRNQSKEEKVKGIQLRNVVRTQEAYNKHKQRHEKVRNITPESELKEGSFEDYFHREWKEYIQNKAKWLDGQFTNNIGNATTCYTPEPHVISIGTPYNPVSDHDFRF